MTPLQVELIQKSLSGVVILTLASVVVALWLAYRSETRERLADRSKQNQDLVDDHYGKLQKALDIALTRIQALEVKIDEEQDRRVQELVKNREELVRITTDSSNAVSKLSASLDAVVAVLRAP